MYHPPLSHSVTCFYWSWVKFITTKTRAKYHRSNSTPPSSLCKTLTTELKPYTLCLVPAMALGWSVLVSVWTGMNFQALLMFVLVFLVLLDYVKNRRPKTFPPAPPGLPFLGNLFTINFKKAHIDLTQLSVHYGNVYSLRTAQSWVVILNGYETIKEALIVQGENLADRPDSVIRTEVCQNLGLIRANGYSWKQQRRFALSTLKYFGVGKKSLEGAILDEFTYLARDLSDKNGKAFDPHLITNYAISNIICSLVFGHRFKYADQRFRKMMQLFREALELEASIWAELYNSFPVVMGLLPGPHQEVLKNWEVVKAFVRTEIEQHKKDRDPNENRDYIDCYLTEMEKNKADVAAGFHEENLVMCAVDLFVAGSETTSTTLRWGFLYMAKYPEVQEKVQEEIDRVIGQSRQPSLADRADMPYTDAVLHEVQRIGNIVPLSLHRTAAKDIQIGKHIIPKGTEIIPNLTSVMFDKSEWETPDTFNPQHFLDKEGKFVKRTAFIPFGAGKRVCLGENLAKMELFLFFTSLLQRFSFSFPAGVMPSMEYSLGVTLNPAPYEICAVPRQPEHH
ncbi:cytochrome P450 2J6-like [Astyanax mexicanus]|uniref:Cytochrome P450 2J6-like n=1 Tax=Astyanax mexicanus TaxID=7994 RepID=A0A8T2LH10_ASTMX|nr:cytochrome P450 2J6-like [Astyanax mexicanus]